MNRMLVQNKRKKVEVKKYVKKFSDQLILQNQNHELKVQKEILRTIYDYTKGKCWRSNKNWLNGRTLDNWYGVVSSLNRVKILKLNWNALRGPIPTIYPQYLEELQLADNELTGKIPSTFPNSLRTLYLNNNKLSGQIPDKFPPRLQSLYLHNNQP
eukprot:UN02476